MASKTQRTENRRAHKADKQRKNNHKKQAKKRAKAVRLGKTIKL